MFALFILLVILLVWYFAVFVRHSEVVSVCYFFRPGCPACSATESYWGKFSSEMVKKHPTIKMNKINVATKDGGAHAEKYGVTHVPMLAKTYKTGKFAFYEGGKLSYDQTGKPGVNGIIVEGWDANSLVSWATK